MPLYTMPPSNRRQDVVDQLQQLVLSGEWQPGDQLPPERSLGERLAVSRTVVREAVRVLAERGLLAVQHGRGTFLRQQNPGGGSQRLRLLVRLRETPGCETRWTHPLL